MLKITSLYTLLSLLTFDLKYRIGIFCLDIYLSCSYFFSIFAFREIAQLQRIASFHPGRKLVCLGHVFFTNFISNEQEEEKERRQQGEKE